MVRFAPANENQGTQSILSDGKSQTRNGAHVSTPQKGGYTVKTGFSWMGTVPRPHRLLTSMISMAGGTNAQDDFPSASCHRLCAGGTAQPVRGLTWGSEGGREERALIRCVFVSSRKGALFINLRLQ